MKATEAAYMVLLRLVYLSFEFSLTVERVVSSPVHIFPPNKFSYLFETSVHLKKYVNHCY
jgi:hypothetical protein